MKKILIAVCLILFTGCIAMHGQLRVDYEKGSKNYWVQEYVNTDGKWVKNGEPFIAPDKMKIYKIWKQR